MYRLDRLTDGGILFFKRKTFEVVKWQLTSFEAIHIQLRIQKRISLKFRSN